MAIRTTSQLPPFQSAKREIRLRSTWGFRSEIAPEHLPEGGARPNGSNLW